MKRKITEDERKLFQTHVTQAVLRPKLAKKLGRDQPPPRAKRMEGEMAVAALAMRRPEGDENELDGNTAEKLRKGQLTPGARMDLHGMTEAAAHGALHSFLAGAQGRGVRLALVITGVGNPVKHEGAEWMRASHGVLKQMVPRWLNEREFAALISGWAPAHKRHGGDGALYVYLRKTGQR
jgi:DNA-nicking Smr family endonuclease